MSSPANITFLPANAFPNILAANVPDNIEGNATFCFSALFMIVSLIPFINNPDCLSDLTKLYLPFFYLKLIMLLYKKLSTSEDLINKVSFE